MGVLKSMTDAIAYRGPDASGHFTAATAGGGEVGLGHRRLSIIDVAAGVQPMHWADRLVISFNGEIYNFKALRQELEGRGAIFSTNSDTEVILAAYEHFGWRCVEKLRGMFAFAIWDTARQTLIVARDRFGKKPVYFTQHPRGIVFASEVKALLRFPGVKPPVDQRAVWDYFAYRYVPGPRTLFEGVHKLPPGCVLICADGRHGIERYYTPPDCEPSDAGAHRDPKDATRVIAEKIEDSVKARLVSDVPFGAFLSGGIDSSVVVGLMAKHMSTPVKTFSVSFKEEQYSEAKYSELVARHFRTDHNELVVDSKDLMEHLPTLVHLRDAPVTEPSDIPIYLLSKQAAQRVKMVLTGEGSDEVLGGYPKHVYERYARFTRWIPEAAHHRLLLPLIRSLPYAFHRAKTAMGALAIHDWHERMARWFGSLSETERSRLLAHTGPTLAADPPVTPVPSESASPLRRILAFDQVSWLPDNLLERGDRMTMGASLEARMPFLDHEFVAAASSLSDGLRVHGTTTKWVLREIARTMLPKVIIERPKVGFRVPVNVWFRTTMREQVMDALLGADSKTADYYRRPSLETVLSEHMSGRHNHEKLIWAMLNLELWHRQYA
jgi:asparagine synthase (glutamine-hydrolysing)